MTGVLLENNQGLSSPEEALESYLNRIRQFPLLSPQQERTLAESCALGDEDAVCTMVNSNLRLVVKIAQGYEGKGVPLMDLIQEGNIGLLIAARKFDPAREYRFSTYASKWICQGMSRCILNHAGLIRVPLHTMERIRKALAVKMLIQQQTGHAPTVEQIAAQSSESVEKTEELLKLVPQIYSLDAPVGDVDDSALQQLLENLQAPQPQDEVVHRELKQTLEMLLLKLTHRQRQVLRLRFGLEDGTCYTLQQIGSCLGISKEAARQTEKQAIEKMKKLGAGLGLEDFLE